MFYWFTPDIQSDETYENGFHPAGILHKYNLFVESGMHWDIT